MQTRFRKLFAGLVALIAPCATTYASNLLPLAELTTQGTNTSLPQLAMLDISGLPAMPKVAMQGTDLRQVYPQHPLLDANGSASLQLDEPAPGNFDSFWPRSDFLMAELPAGTPAGSTISITTSGGVTLCDAVSDGAHSLVCFADIRAYSVPARYMVNVHARDLPQYSSVEVYASGLVLNNNGLAGGGLVATGPGRFASAASFPLRLLGAPSGRSLGAILFDGDGVLGQGKAGILPLAWSSSIRYADVNRPSNPLSPAAKSIGFLLRPDPLAPWDGVTRLYFDLPPNSGTPYSPIKVTMANDYSSSLDWYVVHSEYPSPSASFEVASAPPPAVSASMHGNGTFTIEQPTAGRWYVVLANRDTKATTENVILFATNDSAQHSLHFDAVTTPAIAPGLYYNPSRSGHGISLSQASGQQMLFWYTYLEDGTPTWYQAQAAAPAAGSAWWTAPLYRVAWDGKAHLTQVGNVLLTPTAENRFIFTWYLEDKAGSEVFVPLARNGDCPSLGGASTNLDGAWYAPALSGYGMDVLALPEQQFNLFYLYDDLGIARWSVGNSLPFLASTSMSFRQNAGFCPSCAVTPISSQPIGTVDIDYASDSTGNLATMLQLQPPLSGNWITDQPMRRLTGSSACVR